MVRRGSIGRGAILVLVAAAILIPIGRSGASPVKTNSLNARTVDVSLPGPYNGCTFLDAGATPTTDAINDLIVPSAFLTSSAGNPYGENGPIASAELTSLTPETVKYTITPNEKWSNGTAFNGNDLEGWWLRARALRTVLSDGYRDIKTLTVSKDGDVVTAVFATPYADWNLLFRDVEALGTQGSCSLAALLARPTLGPYSVTSATPNRIVLTMNKHWPVDTDRFGRIVITDSGALPKSVSADFVNFSLVVNRGLVQAISARPNVMSHIGTSSNIEEISFASTRPLIKRIAIRQALSWSINRQALIDQLWGAVTFSPSVAASAIYAQGQSNYPGPAGTAPSSQTTTTTLAPNTAHNGLGDCLECALDVLSQNGFVRTASGWTTAAGAPLKQRWPSDRARSTRASPRRSLPSGRPSVSRSRWSTCEVTSTQPSRRRPTPTTWRSSRARRSPRSRTLRVPGAVPATPTRTPAAGGPWRSRTCSIRRSPTSTR